MPANPIKTSQLPQVYSLAATDRVVVVSNAAGNAVTSTILLPQLMGNSAAIAVISTPASSTSISYPAGSIMTDGTYLYVATANGVLRRVALSSF